MKWSDRLLQSIIIQFFDDKHSRQIEMVSFYLNNITIELESFQVKLLICTTIIKIMGSSFLKRNNSNSNLVLTTLELTPILELPVKEEVVDFSIEGDLLTYEVHVYEDDEMNKGYMETRTLELPTIEN